MQDGPPVHYNGMMARCILKTHSAAAPAADCVSGKVGISRYPFIGMVTDSRLTLSFVQKCQLLNEHAKRYQGRNRK